MYVYNARTFDIIENANYEDYIGDANYIVTDKLLCNPIIDPITMEAREATREELCGLGKLDILENGEVYADGKITYKAPPKEMLKPKWEYPNWVEKAPQDEVKKAYCDLIIDYQTQVLEAGFLWTHTQDRVVKVHNQRARDTDMVKLGTSISTLEDAKAIALRTKQAPMVNTITWHFDDLGEDVAQLTEDELKELRLIGVGLFGNAVYDATKVLKEKEPNMNLTLEEFLTELKKHTNISVLANKE